MEEISFDLVGKVLEEDIVSELDLLLLKKGSILTEINILLLKKHNYKQINVSEDVSFKNLYIKHINHIEHLFTNLEEKKNVNIKYWFEEDQKIVRTVQKNDFFLDQMYKIKSDQSLFRHSVNVGLLSFFLGKLLRYSYKNKLLLWKVGLLHDIGKLKLRRELLTKSEKDLTEEEFHEYKRHPETGWSMLNEMKGVNATMLNGARSHHERIDGSGYPRGIKIKYLPIMVQIVSVANKIDKILMTNDNVFYLVNTLIEETRANKLNPAIVIPFVRHILRKNVGKKVVLNDKTTAEILFIFDQEPSQPLLYLIETDIFIDSRKYHKLKIVDFA
jgi:HD-GYP domain-containing protein (c-di-GMP phosphodiesterase class II)